MAEEKTTFAGDESTTQGKWKREFYKQIANELRITQTSPDIPNVNQADKTAYYDFPRFDLIEYTFDRSKPNEKVVLSGNSALMPLQISLISAIKQILQPSSNDNYQGNAITRRVGNPLIKLFFEEDKPDNVDSKNFIPVQGRISWRLMDFLEYPNDLDKEVLKWEDIERLAERIYSHFQEPNEKKGYVWDKGKISYNYSDWNKGYGLKILCQNESTGREILDKILKINGHNFNSKRVSISKPEVNTDYPEGTEINVLGERQKQPRYRPNVKVRFKNAELLLSKKTQPIKLITRGALERFPR